MKFQSVAQLTKTNVFTEATSMTEVVERLKRCGIKEIEIGDRDVILQHLTMKKLSKEFDFIYSYKRIWCLSSYSLISLEYFERTILQSFSIDVSLS